MRYIKTFNNHSGYTEFTQTDGFLKPNVSHCIMENEVHYNPIDPYNGHTYVDLGLPSGTKWATMNVGANSPTDTGLYFAWGETEGYTAEQVGVDKQFSWNDYKFNPSGDGSTFTKYNSTDGKTVLDLEDDAAHVNWDGDWHMPNSSQCIELFKYTTNGFIASDGIFTQFDLVYGNMYVETDTTASTSFGTAGYLFFNSGTTVSDAISNGKYIFIPANGEAQDDAVMGIGSYGGVFASALSSEDATGVWNLGFNSHQASPYNGGGIERFMGVAVRGVVGQIMEIQEPIGEVEGTE